MRNATKGMGVFFAALLLLIGPAAAADDTLIYKGLVVTTDNAVEIAEMIIENKIEYLPESEMEGQKAYFPIYLIVHGKKRIAILNTLSARDTQQAVFELTRQLVQEWKLERKKQRQKSEEADGALSVIMLDRLKTAEEYLGRPVRFIPDLELNWENAKLALDPQYGTPLEILVSEDLNKDTMIWEIGLCLSEARRISETIAESRTDEQNRADKGIGKLADQRRKYKR